MTIRIVMRGGTVDAYAELNCSGQFGELGLKLLFKLMREEVGRFPVLRPSAGWIDDEVWDWTQSFFVEKGQAVTVAILTQTTDLASMSRYLRRSIRNFIISEARKSEAGRVRRKVEELLAASPDFEQVPVRTPGAGRWRIAGTGGPPYGGERQSLVAAAYSVKDVRAVHWAGRRRQPLASDESLIRILHAVFAAAAGSLEVAEIGWVFLQRFPAAVEQADATIGQEAFDRVTEFAEDNPAVASEVGDDARRVYDQLSPSQRVLLSHLDEPIAIQMQLLAVGRSQAYEA
ncbi:MAG TPA: hypothetical protein VIU87_27350, partial [Mycobacterium sp.]